mgnify:CR=1 FL=1
MNPTQARGKKWLQSNYGLKPDEIQFTGGVPTFTTKEGNGFLTKRVIGKANKVVLFHRSEMEQLMQNPNRNSILLVPDSGEIKSMPARILAEDTETYGDVRLVRVDSETNGQSGEILLHLSRRTSESHHFRINHVPMDSMLVFRDYTGRLSISAGANGKPDFWLALRPEMISP